jgi:hypothetical protein
MATAYALVVRRCVRILYFEVFDEVRRIYREGDGTHTGWRFHKTRRRVVQQEVTRAVVRVY